MPCSIQPILDAQAGHFLEIHQVPRQQQRIVGEANCGDLQVHGADANALALQPIEAIRRLVIEGDEDEFAQQLQAVLELLVSPNLRPSRALPD